MPRKARGFSDLKPQQCRPSVESNVPGDALRAGRTDIAGGSIPHRRPVLPWVRSTLQRAVFGVDHNRLVAAE